MRSRSEHQIAPQPSRSIAGAAQGGDMPQWAAVAVAVVAAVGLTWLFWRPLWTGGGLVGADVYAYYFPQKTFYSDELHAGRVPLWNPLVGHGYPVLAESQTGVLYPPHLALYGWCRVNTAYNAVQIGHYVLAFLATWLLARRLGLGPAAALFASLVFVYGWFPVRICLEWAIFGGVYFPLMAWSVESYLQTDRRRYLVILAGALAVHLLAGHYNLAFISMLTVAAYAALRLRGGHRVADERETGFRAALTGPPLAAPRRPPWQTVGAVVGALAIGFALAGVQLAPTWELKQRSQREDVGNRHDPGYGHLPPWYLCQVATPWMWYAPDVDADEALGAIKTLSIPSLTNKVEAHLYFGLLPLALAAGGLWRRFRSGAGTPQALRLWGWLGVAAVVYATGWLVPICRHLPGFGFFMGPGRYGIVTTLAVALLAAYSLQDWLRGRRSGLARALGVVVVLTVTTADLWVVRCYWNRTSAGSPNWYADLVPDPPVAHRDESDVRRVLGRFPRMVRMRATYQNLPTLTGFAMTPTYLGLGPAEYFDPALLMPTALHDPPSRDDIAAQVAWMRRAGTTHILSEQRLDPAKWPVRLVWEGYDPMLHRAWARSEPLWLYELEQTRGRVSLEPGGEQSRAEVVDYEPDRVTIDVESPVPQRLVLTDLDYPGWGASIDGNEAETLRIDGMFRGVDVPAGRHTVVWTYRPRSLWWGGGISATALLAGCVWLFWAGGAIRLRSRS